MFNPDGRHVPELDPHRPKGTAGSESILPKARLGPTTLAERGGAGAVCFDPSRGRRSKEGRQAGSGAGAVRDSGDVREVGGRGDAGEGSEHGDGGPGWDALEREGEPGNFGQGSGG